MSKKQLYYEIIEDGEQNVAPDETAERSDNSELINVVPSYEPERDAYAELMRAAKAIKRVKYRVKPDYSGKRTAVGIALGVAVALGALLIGLLKNTVAIIVVCAIVLAAVVAAVIAMCVLTAAQNKPHYCMYVRNGGDVKCLSVVGERVVYFAGGAAYRLNGEEFYSLDGAGFINYLEGECSGLVAVLNAKREDVSADDNVYTVKNAVGGGHTVYIEDGKITAIVSEQPIEAGVDGATGMSVIKTERFVKCDPVYEFDFVIPERTANALRERGIDVNS